MPDPFLTGIGILIIDDNTTLANAVSSVLTMWGADVSAANDARSALRLFRRTLPDIVLVEILLPGISKVMAIVADESPSTAIVVISGEPTLAMTEAAFEARACHYLVKPVDAPRLHAAMLIGLGYGG